MQLEAKADTILCTPLRDDSTSKGKTNFWLTRRRIPEQKGGHKDNCPTHLRRWISRVPEEPVELEALRHEDRLRRLLQQVLEVPLVCVGGQVVHRPRNLTKLTSFITQVVITRGV